jgi:hypothetical protein
MSGKITIEELAHQTGVSAEDLERAILVQLG